MSAVMVDGIDPVTPWMQTTSGRHVSLLEPKVDMIDLDDIATALAHLRRFTGHARFSRPWTVAQHSLCVARIVETLGYRGDNKMLRTAVLHDATEAYIGDLSRPLKQSLRILSGNGPSPLDIIESRLWGAIAVKFNLWLRIPDVVKEADAIALGIEADELFGPGTAEAWNLPSWVGRFVDDSGDLASYVEAVS